MSFGSKEGNSCQWKTASKDNRPPASSPPSLTTLSYQKATCQPSLKIRGTAKSQADIIQV